MIRLAGPVTGLILDTGALIALERRDERIRALLDTAERSDLPVVIPAGALAQAWRNGSRQVQLARFVGSPPVVVEPLDEHRAKAAGELCAAAGHADMIDASVALCATVHEYAVVTSDSDDINKFNPSLTIIAI